jgi:CHAT domain-containing protein
VLDAMAGTFAAVRQRVVDVGDKDLFDQLKDTTARLARLALGAANPASAEQREHAIKNLEAAKERLEAQLSEHSAEFRAQVQPVTLEAVQAAIPDDAALLEFAIFRPFDPRAERNAEAYGPAHYAAYVVRKQDAPRGFDLGPADAINEAIGGLRQALRDPKRADVQARARAVDERVMRPLRAAFGEATRLIVSPDGELNLVPFEALVDEHGRYLIERHAISYVTSGRDLLRMQVPRANRSKPVIFADPVFGEPASAAVEPSNRKPVSNVAARRSVTTGQDLSAVYFAPLAATAEEGRAIKTLFPDATLFTGQRARKAALQRVEAPRMLHIASHGFFLKDARVNGENPLLRSGLALAGANLPHDTHEGGILTALEATGLNLWGTKLVTLSACDTGIGEVRNGEGVYGLRRAFVLAGTEALVMSLWPVNDSIARETMVAYYTGLRAGLGRGDALRQAKLAMLKRSGRQHPFYWASFIQSGDWTSLDGRS